MKEENYISGIYNYCDRWCERCDFITHFPTYSMGRELGEKSSQHFSFAELWKIFQQYFDENQKSLQELINGDGTDWDFFQKKTTSLGKFRRHFFWRKKSVPQSSAIIYRLSNDYVNKYSIWKKANQELLEKGHEQSELIFDVLDVIS